MEQVTDWAGEWYRIRKANGESDLVTLLRVGKNADGTTRTEDFSFSHADFDGIGGMITALRKCGDLITEPRSTKKFQRPGFIAYTKAILKALGMMKLSGVNWKQANDFSVATPSPSASVFLDEKEFQTLQAKAKQQGLTVNSMMLTTLHRCVAPLLKDPNQQILWLFPVNMRGPLGLPNPLMNQSSGLLLPISKSTTPAELNRKILEELKDNLQWGVWFLNTIGRFIGKKGMKHLSKRNQKATLYGGTFSDLGQWTSQPGYKSLAEKDWWSASPPGSPNFPVGFVHCTFDQRMSWTLKIHPHILDPRVGPDKILAEMQSRIFTEFSGNQ